jgi:[acyl-carrier-protein] S-malonyltransferase
MVAVRGSKQRLRDVVSQAGRVGEVYSAGQTTKDTHLVTGERAALQAAASQEGVSSLPVSGPWHSPLMQPAADELRARFESAVEDEAEGPKWVSNETGGDASLASTSVAELLLAQLTNPMRLHQAIEFVLAQGTTDIVVLGPHHALSHIVRRHLAERPSVRIHSTSSMDQLKSAVRELS